MIFGNIIGGSRAHVLNFFLKGDFHLNREIDDFRQKIGTFCGETGRGTVTKIPPLHPYAPTRSRITI